MVWPERGTTEAGPGELLVRCRQGDPEAWDQLVARYERLVFSVALRNGLTREDAADVTQATFLALLESLERLKDDERLASWLMTVCRRQAWAQRNRVRLEVADVDLPDGALDNLDNHDPTAHWDELTALHDALDALDRPCRDLLGALYLDPTQPSYTEIAQRLGRRIGGIGPMRARCLQRIRQLVDTDALP